MAKAVSDPARPFAALENTLRTLLHEDKKRKFEKESRAALESYNEFVAENGLWGEEYREW